MINRDRVVFIQIMNCFVNLLKLLFLVILLTNTVALKRGGGLNKSFRNISSQNSTETVSSLGSDNVSFIVSVQVRVPNAVGKIIVPSCVGTIINVRWVLVVAHCLKSSDPNIYSILAGIANRRLEEEYGHRFDVLKVVKHEKQFLDEMDHKISVPYDIGLIKVASAFKYNTILNYINLPGKNAMMPRGPAFLFTLSNHDINCTDFRLQRIALNLIDISACRIYFPGDITDQMKNDILCTEPNTPFKTACRFIPGSPLVQRSEIGEFLLIGIVSWSDTRCTEEHDGPTIYTRISSFNNWLIKEMKSW